MMCKIVRRCAYNKTYTWTTKTYNQILTYTEYRYMLAHKHTHVYKIKVQGTFNLTKKYFLTRRRKEEGSKNISFSQCMTIILTIIIGQKAFLRWIYVQKSMPVFEEPQKRKVKAMWLLYLHFLLTRHTFL